MERFRLFGFLILTSMLAASGCVARTYSLTRDRVDQDTSAGNRGYIMGKAPENIPTEKSATRTTQVIEIELGFPKKVPAKNVEAALPASLNEEETAVASPQQEEAPAQSGSFEKYTVKKNDTLQKISKKFYGTTRKWVKIYEANKDTLKGPDKVIPGQALNIPSEAGMKTAETETKENLK